MSDVWDGFFNPFQHLDLRNWSFSEQIGSEWFYGHGQEKAIRKLEGGIYTGTKARKQLGINPEYRREIFLTVFNIIYIMRNNEG